jgi:beta-lactamase class D
MRYIFLLIVTAIFFGTSCSVNDAHIDNDLKRFFDSAKVEGCFTMLDNVSGKVTVYNMNLDTQRFTPASTFKIVNSLIGLETGKASGPEMVIKWDGVKRWNEDWNKDMTMKEAFKVSNVGWYQELARRIGMDTMKMFIDSLKYGNRNLGNSVDSFWLNNALKISPDEQLGLVKKLYFNQLPFQKRSHEVVKTLMLHESTTLYKLSYKTGWGFDEQKRNIGWIVGWIEENNHVYFFVTFLRSPDPNLDMRTVRMNITRGILSHYGFFKGEK